MPYQLYSLQGDKVKEFLQGQLCSDVTILQNNKPMLTGICNAKGRLVASPYIILQDDQYYLVLSKNMGDILLSYWKAYLMISRIQMLPIENNTFDLDHLFAYDYLIKNKLVLIQPATTKLYMPITLGYENFNALSFNKGCYVGQEILARIHFKGTVKRQVVTIQFTEATTITAYQKIIDSNNKTAGHIALAPSDAKPITCSLAVIFNDIDTTTLNLDDQRKVIVAE